MYAFATLSVVDWLLNNIFNIVIYKTKTKRYAIMFYTIKKSVTVLKYVLITLALPVSTQ